MGGLLRLAQHLSRRLGTPGYLCVDDVVIEKPFARLLPWPAWTDSFAKKRKVYGCHVVLLSWTSDPAGTWRIPVAFRLWRPKRSCAPGRYQRSGSSRARRSGPPTWATRSGATSRAGPRP